MWADLGITVAVSLAFCALFSFFYFAADETRGGFLAPLCIGLAGLLALAWGLVCLPAMMVAARNVVSALGLWDITPLVVVVLFLLTLLGGIVIGSAPFAFRDTRPPSLE